MADLNIAVSINGTLDLDLSEANGYLVTTVGPGARIWRRNLETSPYIHGDDEVGRTLAPSSLLLQVLIRASSHSALATRIANFINALEQSSYQLTATIEGVTWTWLCRCADTAPGGESGGFDANRLRNIEQLWTATIPRHPIPVAGPA